MFVSLYLGTAWILLNILYNRKHVKFANHISSITASWNRDCLDGKKRKYKKLGYFMYGVSQQLSDSRHDQTRIYHVNCKQEKTCRCYFLYTTHCVPNVQSGAYIIYSTHISIRLYLLSDDCYQTIYA